MTTSSSLKVTIDTSKSLNDAIKALLKRELLIGIPGDQGARAPAPGEPSPPNNAVIGYVQEFGDDDRNIPARPFLMPGVESAKAAIVHGLERAGKAVMDGNTAGLDAGFTAAGLAAQASVKKAILDGDFAPLSERTLQARARRAGKSETSKAARRELANRAAGIDPSTDARPLYDTHSLFNAVTFVVADKGKG